MIEWRLMVSAALAAVLSTGCPDTGSEEDGGDAGPDGDLDGGELSLSPPSPPSLPVLTPCPDGWREIPADEEGAATCDPWPEGGIDDCDGDQAHLPGQPGCATISAPCPAGDWAEDLPADREILYVLAGASEGGDGSALAPFATIGEATEAAAADTVIAVGKGTYEESVDLRGELLWGACAAETSIVTTTPSMYSATLNLRGDGSEARHVSVSGPRIGIFVGGSTGARLEGVVVDGAVLYGMQVAFSSEVTAEGLVVRDTEADPGNPATGNALFVEAESTATLRRASLERNRYLGVFGTGANTTVVLEDTVVRDMRGQPGSGRLGGGIAVDFGARLEATRVVVSRARYLAVHVMDPDTTAVLDHVVVQDTLSQEVVPDASRGRGLFVLTGSAVEVTRSVFERCREHGVYIENEGTEATLTDVVIRDTASREGDGAFGWGLGLAHGARAELLRVEVARNRYAGILVHHSGSHLLLEDAWIHDTTPHEEDQSAEGFGFGLGVDTGSEARVVRALIEGNAVDGVNMDRGAVAELEDVVVRDTESDPLEGYFGRGISVGNAAVLSARRVEVEGNRDVGVMVSGEDTRVTMAETAIRGTLERSCVTGACAGAGAGIGVVSVGGAVIELTRFVVADSDQSGIQIALGGWLEGGLVNGYDAFGAIDLHEGIVSGNAVGANVQDPDYDLERLTDRVLFLDNGRDFDGDTMPVPNHGETPLE